MFREFIHFDKMLTPLIIKIVFWIGVAFFVLMGIATMFEEGFLSVLGGLLTIILGPLLVRVYCELIIIMFKIHESLNQLRKKVDYQNKDNN